MYLAKADRVVPPIAGRHKPSKEMGVINQLTSRNQPSSRPRIHNPTTQKNNHAARPQPSPRALHLRARLLPPNRLKDAADAHHEEEKRHGGQLRSDSRAPHAKIMHDPRNEERAEHPSRPTEKSHGRLRSADDEGPLEHLVPTQSPEIAQTGRLPRFLEERRPLFSDLTKDRHA